MGTTRLWNNLLHSKSKDRKAKKLKGFGIGNTKGPKQNSQNRLNQARENIPEFPLEFVDKNRISVQVDNFFSNLLPRLYRTNTCVSAGIRGEPRLYRTRI
jgi:hypothetical protein